MYLQAGPSPLRLNCRATLISRCAALFVIALTAYVATDTSSLVTARAADSTDAKLAELDERFAPKFSEIAATCDELALADQAAVTRSWLIRRDPGRQYLFVPADEDTLLPDANDPQVVHKRQWYNKFREVRAERAQALWEIAREECKSGDATRAYRFLCEVLRDDPDHADARKILGYTRDRSGAWRRAGAPIRAKLVTVPEERLGWAARKYWEIESPHYRILTNDSPEAGVELAGELETLVELWRQVYTPYWITREELARRIDRPALPVAAKRKYKVALFRNRDEYIERLRTENPQVELSQGMYFDGVQMAFFYSGDAQARATWYHEATHQLFQEVEGVSSGVAERASAWIIEGVAQYMESLTPRDGYYTVGGIDARRVQYARSWALGARYYMPLAELGALGRPDLQQHDDVRRLYSQAAGLTHYLMDGEDGKYRSALSNYLTLVYRARDRDDSLAALTGVSLADLDDGYRRWLDVTDAELESLQPSPLVRELGLGNTSVTDAGMAHLAVLRDLEELDLSGTKVTDEGLSKLAPLVNLKVLNVGGTAVTPEGLARLKERIPALGDSP